MVSTASTVSRRIGRTHNCTLIEHLLWYLRSGATWENGENWAVSSSRRNAVSMSAVGGACLLRYQGVRARWAATSAAGCPCWCTRWQQAQTGQPEIPGLRGGSILAC